MPETVDRFNLQRFLDAQATVYGNVCSELRRGRKESHWMWFIFPQIQGLGSSATARHYAISGLDEAAAYIDHPVLGPRLRECTALVNAIRGATAREIFGHPDHLKFHSSMTLFVHACSNNGVFLDALGKYFHSSLDLLTMQRL